MNQRSSLNIVLMLGSYHHIDGNIHALHLFCSVLEGGDERAAGGGL